MYSAPVFATAKGSVDNQTVTSDVVDSSGSEVINFGVTCNSTGDVIVSDNKGNTWVEVGTAQVNGLIRERMFQCLAPINGPGHTFTATAVFGNVFPGIAAEGWNGALLASALDQANKNGSASATTTNTGSVTPIEDNELIVTVAGADLSVVSIDSGFTIGASAAGTATALACSIAHKIQTTAAAENPTWTFTATPIAIAAKIATFKAAPNSGMLMLF